MKGRDLLTAMRTLIVLRIDRLLAFEAVELAHSRGSGWFSLCRFRVRPGAFVVSLVVDLSILQNITARRVGAEADDVARLEHGPVDPGVVDVGSVGEDPRPLVPIADDHLRKMAAFTRYVKRNECGEFTVYAAGIGYDITSIKEVR